MQISLAWSQTIKRLYFVLVKAARRMHYWLVKNPKNCTPLEGINVILIGINSFLISDIMMPNAIVNWADIKPAYFDRTILVISLMMAVLIWGATGIIKTIIGKGVGIPIKYKFLLLLSSIPVLILINKFLFSLKIVNKDYEKQNNCNN